MGCIIGKMFGECTKYYYGVFRGRVKGQWKGRYQGDLENGEMRGSTGLVLCK